MLAEREHDYFAETAICANCYIVAIFFSKPWKEIRAYPPTLLYCFSASSNCDLI